MQVLADEDQLDRDAALGLALERADDDADVVIGPLRDETRGMTTWQLSRTGAPQGMTIAKLLVTRKVPARLRVHPGRDWFTVLSGTIVLRLGERTILVRAGQAAEFSTMEPQAFGVQEGADGSAALLIRGFGVRVPGGAPVLTWPYSFLAKRLLSLWGMDGAFLGHARSRAIHSGALA